jgi:hypothetical protein
MVTVSEPLSERLTVTLHGGQGCLGRVLAGHKTTPVSSLIRSVHPLTLLATVPHSLFLKLFARCDADGGRLGGGA